MDILRWVDQTRAATEDSAASGASNAERLRSRKRRRLSSPSAPLSASQFSAFSGDIPVAGDVASTGIAARATTPTPGRGTKRPPTAAADQEDDRDVRRDGSAVLNDLDSTPRSHLPPALHRRAVPRYDDAASESASSLASRGTKDSSTAGSGTSSRSPRKRFRAGARAVKDHPLSTDMADGLPARLLAFCLELDEIVRGKGIAGASSKVLQPLSSSIHRRLLLTSPEPYFQAHPRDAIQSLGAQDEGFTLTRSRVGSTLEPDQCLALLSSAMTCQGESHPEIS